MKKPNHTCVVCGKEYYACDRCDELNGIGSWRKFCETPGHYKVFQIASMYLSKSITKQEAKQYLENCDISDSSTYTQDIQKAIKEITVTPKPAKTRNSESSTGNSQK